MKLPNEISVLSGSCDDLTEKYYELTKFNPKILKLDDSFEDYKALETFLTANEDKIPKTVLILILTYKSDSAGIESKAFDFLKNGPLIINAIIEPEFQPKVFYRQPHENCYKKFQSEGTKKRSRTYDLFDSKYSTILDDYETILHLNEAIIEGDLLLIKYLKLFKLDLKIKNKEQIRPLEIAVSKKSSKIFFELIDYEASNEIKDPHILEVLTLKNKDGKNLLMLAVESENIEIVNFFLTHEFVDVNYKIGEISAISLAIEKKNNKIIELLLKFDSKYPKNLSKCSREIKNFISMINGIHKLIRKGKLAQIKKKLPLMPTLRILYNSDGISAVAAALQCNQLDIFEFLISQGFKMGKDEDIQDFVEEDSKTDIRNVIRSHLKTPFALHIQKILQNMRISYECTKKEQQHFSNLIYAALNKLDQIREVSIILKAIATSKDWKLIFEFNRSEVDQIDPTSGKGTLGLFYSNGWVYVAAKGLIDGCPREVLGTISHELAHYALKLAYDNGCSPFKEGDVEGEREFNEIVNEYKNLHQQGSVDEEIITRVFDYYDEESFNAELIVRIPEMCAYYADKTNVLDEKRIKYHKLFDYYNKVYDDLEKMILREELKSKVDFINSVVGLKSDFEKRKEMFALKDSIIFRDKIFDFQIMISNCPMLTAMSLKEQNEDIFLIIYFESLSIEKIKDMINEAFSCEIKPILVIFVRNDITQNKIDEIKAKYEKVLIVIGENKSGNNLENDAQYNVSKIIHKFSDLTESSRENFSNHKVLFQNVEVILSEIFSDFQSSLLDDFPLNILFDDSPIIIGKEVPKYDEFYYERYLLNKSYPDELLNIHTLMFKKIVLLSDEPGMGKSTQFEKIAFQLKKEYPLKWIAYIDLKLYFGTFRKFQNVQNWTHVNIVEIFSHMFKLSTAEKIVFHEKVLNRQVVFLFDGIDEIAPDYKEFIVKLMTESYLLTHNQLWMASRPHCIREIEQILNTDHYCLSAIDQDKFIDEFVNFNRLDSSEKEKIRKFIDEIYLECNESFTNPLLLMIIMKIYENLCEDDNLYTFYDKFLNKKFERIVGDSGKGEIRREDFIKLRADVDKIHIKIAVEQFEADEKFKKLEIFRYDYSNVSTDTIFGFGILFGDSLLHCFFIHQTIKEFLISKYFVEYVLNTLSCDEDEKVLRMEFFWRVFAQKHYKQIQRFLDFYLQHKFEIAEKENLSLTKFLHKKLDEQCKLLNEEPNDKNRKYFFHHIFSHLFNFKMLKKYLFKVLLLDELEVQIERNELESIWNFTLNYFDNGKKILMDMLTRAKANDILKIPSFFEGIKMFHKQDFDCFLNLISCTFNKDDIQRFIFGINVENISFDDQSNISKFSKQLSAKNDTEDTSEYVRFLLKHLTNFEDYADHVFELVVNSGNNIFTLFSMLNTKVSINCRKRILKKYIEKYGNEYNLGSLWKLTRNFRDKDLFNKIFACLMSHMSLYLWSTWTENLKFPEDLNLIKKVSKDEMIFNEWDDLDFFLKIAINKFLKDNEDYLLLSLRFLFKLAPKSQQLAKNIILSKVEADLKTIDNLWTLCQLLNKSFKKQFLVKVFTLVEQNFRARSVRYEYKFFDFFWKFAVKYSKSKVIVKKFFNLFSISNVLNFAHSKNLQKFLQASKKFLFTKIKCNIYYHLALGITSNKKDLTENILILLKALKKYTSGESEVVGELKKLLEFHEASMSIINIKTMASILISAKSDGAISSNAVMELLSSISLENHEWWNYFIQEEAKTFENELDNFSKNECMCGENTLRIVYIILIALENPQKITLNNENNPELQECLKFFIKTSNGLEILKKFEKCSFDDSIMSLAVNYFAENHSYSIVKFTSQFVEMMKKYCNTNSQNEILIKFFERMFYCSILRFYPQQYSDLIREVNLIENFSNIKILGWNLVQFGLIESFNYQQPSIFKEIVDKLPYQSVRTMLLQINKHLGNRSVLLELQQLDRLTKPSLKILKLFLNKKDIKFLLHYSDIFNDSAFMVQNLTKNQNEWLKNQDLAYYLEFLCQGYWKLKDKIIKLFLNINDTCNSIAEILVKITEIDRFKLIDYVYDEIIPIVNTNACKNFVNISERNLYVCNDIVFVKHLLNDLRFMIHFTKASYEATNDVHFIQRMLRLKRLHAVSVIASCINVLDNLEFKHFIDFLNKSNIILDFSLVNDTISYDYFDVSNHTLNKNFELFLNFLLEKSFPIEKLQIKYNSASVLKILIKVNFQSSTLRTVALNLVFRNDIDVSIFFWENSSHFVDDIVIEEFLKIYFQKEEEEASSHSDESIIFYFIHALKKYLLVDATENHEDKFKLIIESNEKLKQILFNLSFVTTINCNNGICIKALKLNSFKNVQEMKNVFENFKGSIKRSKHNTFENIWDYVTNLTSEESRESLEKYIQEKLNGYFWEFECILALICVEKYNSTCFIEKDCYKKFVFRFFKGSNTIGCFAFNLFFKLFTFIEKNGNKQITKELLLQFLNQYNSGEFYTDEEFKSFLYPKFLEYVPKKERKENFKIKKNKILPLFFDYYRINSNSMI